MKLLSVGTTFGEPKDGPNEFKMQQELLPKFGSRRNVFPNVAKPAPISPSRQSQVSGVTFSSTNIQLTAYSKAPSRKAPKRGLFWALESLFGRSGASRKKTAPLVQTEWALEQVKVVRNDLSDTDIFVRTAEEPAVAAPTAEIKEGGWSKAFKPWKWFK